MLRCVVTLDNATKAREVYIDGVSATTDTIVGTTLAETSSLYLGVSDDLAYSTASALTMWLWNSAAVPEETERNDGMR